jgi:hypothetical protein
MQTAIEQFRANTAYVRNLRAIHDALKTRTTRALDLSDLLRAQLVMLVSALDCFVHEVARRGMIEGHVGKRVQTESFQRFPVSLAAVKAALADPQNMDWLSAEIITRHGYMAFQYPDKIAEAIRLVSSVRLWERVGKLMGSNPKDVKRQIELIVQRRNKIVHEADANPSTPGVVGARWPIDEKMVDDSIVFVETVCEHIFSLVK